MLSSLTYLQARGKPSHTGAFTVAIRMREHHHLSHASIASSKGVADACSTPLMPNRLESSMACHSQHLRSLDPTLCPRPIKHCDSW